MKAHTVGLFTMSLLVSCAVQVRADPFVITGGSIGQANGLDLPGFEITAPNTMFGAVLPIAGVICCSFNVGEPVSLSRSFSFTTLAGQPQVEIINGVRYGQVWVSGGADFTAAPFTAPPVNGATSFRFTTPFAMTGQIAGYADQAHTQLLFSEAVTGSGTATVSGDERASQPNYVGQILTFAFEQPAATPEPASLLLLGTAVAGLLVRRRLRAKRP